MGGSQGKAGLVVKSRLSRQSRAGGQEQAVKAKKVEGSRVKKGSKTGAHALELNYYQTVKRSLSVSGMHTQTRTHRVARMPEVTAFTLLPVVISGSCICKARVAISGSCICKARVAISGSCMWKVSAAISGSCVCKGLVSISGSCVCKASVATYRNCHKGDELAPIFDNTLAINALPSTHCYQRIPINALPSTHQETGQQCLHHHHHSPLPITIANITTAAGEQHACH
eukprot:1150168-Pelagomonas_calceolata.AAC.5